MAFDVYPLNVKVRFFFGQELLGYVHLVILVMRSLSHCGASVTHLFLVVVLDMKTGGAFAGLAVCRAVSV